MLLILCRSNIASPQANVSSHKEDENARLVPFLLILVLTKMESNVFTGENVQETEQYTVCFDFVLCFRIDLGIV